MFKIVLFALVSSALCKSIWNESVYKTIVNDLNKLENVQTLKQDLKLLLVKQLDLLSTLEEHHTIGILKDVMKKHLSTIKKEDVVAILKLLIVEGNPKMITVGKEETPLTKTVKATILSKPVKETLKPSAIDEEITKEQIISDNSRIKVTPKTEQMEENIKLEIHHVLKDFFKMTEKEIKDMRKLTEANNNLERVLLKLMKKYGVKEVIEILLTLHKKMMMDYISTQVFPRVNSKLFNMFQTVEVTEEQMMKMIESRDVVKALQTLFGKQDIDLLMTNLKKEGLSDETATDIVRSALLMTDIVVFIKPKVMELFKNVGKKFLQIKADMTSMPAYKIISLVRNMLNRKEVNSDVVSKDTMELLQNELHKVDVSNTKEVIKFIASLVLTVPVELELQPVPKYNDQYAKNNDHFVI